MSTDLTIYKVGDTLRNGAMVIAIQKRARHDDSRVVLAYREGNDEYVTWVMDADGNTFWGHYFFDIAKAAADFAERIG